MGVTSASQHDDAGRGPGLPTDGDASVGTAAPATRPEAFTRQLVTAQVGERCITCEAPLASDQRYCLNCGERRGNSGLKPAQPAAQTEPRAAVSMAESTDSRRRRTTSGTTLVAGIATLLLAMGVGVEIGRISNGNNSGGSPARASAPSVQVVTVGSGVGGSAAASTPSSSQGKTKRKGKTTAKKAAAQTVVTKKVAAKATQAASKVLGASAKNLAPPTVQSGQACTSGAGCQNGKFTGNFFGP